MFQNIGEKIKALTIFFMIIAIVLTVAGAIACWGLLDSFWTGFFVLVGGCLISVMGAFLLYGFGELITQTTKIAKGIQNMQVLSVCQNNGDNDDSAKDMIEEIQSEVISNYEAEKFENEMMSEEDEINEPERNECPSCFHKIGPNDEECPYCGYKLK